MSIPLVRYRVRVSYVPTRPPAEPSDTGHGDYFIYQVGLWPTSKPAPLAVLKHDPRKAQVCRASSGADVSRIK